MIKQAFNSGNIFSYIQNVSPGEGKINLKLNASVKWHCKMHTLL